MVGRYDQNTWSTLPIKGKIEGTLAVVGTFQDPEMAPHPVSRSLTSIEGPDSSAADCPKGIGGCAVVLYTVSTGIG